MCLILSENAILLVPEVIRRQVYTCAFSNVPVVFYIKTLQLAVA